MRDAREYDLYLPLRFNDGSPIEPEKIARLKKRLHDRFGGLTFFPQQNEGIWKVGTVTFREEIVILRTLAEQQGNMSRTAEVLGVERSNLYRKMKTFGIAPSRRADGDDDAA